ncbi:MAG TPA: ATP-binding cassette domain-containing protein [Pyrinomonadaceae bacterium]|nr:ATP-binding cassette domain-containing protein [Pyrinomonadaceae bacterium]
MNSEKISERISVDVREVTKSFGDFKAVDKLSFQIRSGRVFGFLGPNGAGKTTTMRMLVGITIPDEGSIELFGEKISPKTQDRIGYLPEERGLYKKARVIDQLRYFAALKGVNGIEANKRIDAWLDRMRLTEWRNKKTSDLSKGMQQKLQFISTVIHDPDLLILDEPFSGLDPVNVEFMIEVLDEFRQREKTVIFSTHLMETAERLCHDILLINKSKKVLSGSIREIKESFGKHSIIFRGTGADSVLSNKQLIEEVTEFPDYLELKPASGVSNREILSALVMAGAEITRFELKEPSLNDIFIECVKNE